MIPERLGNLHLVFLHLPIGLVVAALLMELWRWRRPTDENAWLQGRLLAANAVAALLTAGAGLLLASAGSYAETTLAWHRWSGVGCAGLAIAAWLVHARGGVWPARVTLALLFGATVIAGHQGATLTHGPGVTALWGKPMSTTPQPERSVEVAAASWMDESDIRPVLQRACFDCHGPEKARGRLRLDTREAMLAGGKSGRPAISAGRPEASEVLRRVRLPRDHDEAMPPEDHPGLTAAEIAALERWIAAGAKW